MQLLRHPTVAARSAAHTASEREFLAILKRIGPLRSAVDIRHYRSHRRTAALERALRRQSRELSIEALQEAGNEFAADLGSARNVSH
jgi:hypothetical protein